MGSCAVVGGCPSDYIAISIAALSYILLVYRSILPFIVHRLPRANGSAFWLPIIQLFASFFLLLSLVISLNFLKLNKKHWWLSCYLWAVWFEGPFGFGLLLCCRISQAFHLFFIFVKRRLPPIRSFIFLPLILSPWIAAAIFIHVSKPLNDRCHLGTHWTIVIVCLHASYIAALVGFTGAIRHVEFRFHEVKDLWQGILVSALVIGIWVTAYVLNEVHDNVPWLQVVSRFFLLFAASILVLAFFSISSLQPLLSQISLRKRQLMQFQTMGQVLGIPDSGLLVQLDPSLVIDPNEPLDKLLLNRKFRLSFMAFADSCLAGESVRFYSEVHELGKIPLDDSVRRIYMARHIIQTYIVAGAAMEVNISHQTRQDILNTPNLADPELFNTALLEVLQLMKMNLVKDYWSSMFFIKFKEETSMRSNGHELEQMGGWNFSPRLSTMQNIDDPFHHELALKSSSSEDHDQRTL